jgi:hypothetical protein
VNGASCCGRVVDHFFDELKGAQAVSMEGEAGRVVDIGNGLVNCH